jgi:hypothetical protein
VNLFTESEDTLLPSVAFREGGQEDDDAKAGYP